MRPKKRNRTESSINKLSLAKPKIQNIVCTIELNMILDLRKIALRAKNSEFNSKRFHALIMRSRDPKATALIFKSGKMVCTGAKNETKCKEAIAKFVRSINQAGFKNIKLRNYQIRNIVASTDFKSPLRLESIQYAYKGVCMYEPEVFPGLIFKPVNTKAVVMLFASGKVVFTGAKSQEELERIHNFILRVIIELKSYEKLYQTMLDMDSYNLFDSFDSCIVGLITSIATKTSNRLCLIIKTGSGISLLLTNLLNLINLKKIKIIYLFFDLLFQLNSTIARLIYYHNISTSRRRLNSYYKFKLLNFIYIYEFNNNKLISNLIDVFSDVNDFSYLIFFTIYKYPCYQFIHSEFGFFINLTSYLNLNKNKDSNHKIRLKFHNSRFNISLLNYRKSAILKHSKTYMSYNNKTNANLFSYFIEKGDYFRKIFNLDLYCKQVPHFPYTTKVKNIMIHYYYFNINTTTRFYYRNLNNLYCFKHFVEVMKKTKTYFFKILKNSNSSRLSYELLAIINYFYLRK